VRAHVYRYLGFAFINLTGVPLVVSSTQSIISFETIFGDLFGTRPAGTRPAGLTG
jgi:hypothetical protein